MCIFAETSLNFYDEQMVGIAKASEPSARGGMEIIRVSQAYLEQCQLNLQAMGYGHAWLNTGTHDTGSTCKGC